MAIIERNRKIRPSTRDASSSYKVDCEKVCAQDQLIVNITHESDPSVHFTYEINGREIATKNSLHFEAALVNGRWAISWIDKVNIRQVR